MVRVQIDLSKRHNKIIESAIEQGIHKTKREVIRAALENYKKIIKNGGNEQ